MVGAVSENRLRSYPKVHAIGHRSIRDIFKGPVVVQEKVDGSQFSFGNVGGNLMCRSKGAVVYRETVDGLFKGAVETAARLHEAGLLPEGWTYRGEAMRAPKHNALAYERAPSGNFILFDVDVGLEHRADPVTLEAEAERLGLEHVPVHFVGEVTEAQQLMTYLRLPSVLGGRTEGIVVKNYARWGEDGKMLMGKLVADDFKEINAKNWKQENPGKRDAVAAITAAYRTEARWAKAVQHLREAGKLDESPKDIGPLMREIPADVLAECEAEIKDALFAAFWKDISRGITAGVAEWYKAQLAGVDYTMDTAA